MIEIPDDIVRRAKAFDGAGDQLEAALGAYVIAKLYGWRSIAMLHTPATRRRIDEILGVRLADVAPEYTDLSQRVGGVRIAKKIGAFWKVANSAKYPNRRTLGKPLP
ncbi:hypothetical protein [Rubrivirga sp.]|uniref:hypothetical protein n=1 Tax=Rubrivirga sp. TaxID=1885344 RepID=UPI003C766659